MKEIVMEEIGKAVEILFNLDILLSHHFVRQPDHPNDQGVAGVRQSICNALDALNTKHWLSHAENIDKVKDSRPPF